MRQASWRVSVRSASARREVNGGIELAKLILTLMEARDVGSTSPVTQLIGCFS